MQDFENGLVVGMALSAFFTGVLFLRFAISANSRFTLRDALQATGTESGQSRIQRADENRERVSPVARYVVSAVAFIVGAALLAHVVTPALAYAVLCLVLAARAVADQVAEERAPRRRSAVLGRARGIDPVLLTWIALTGASALALVPWLLDPAYRFAAVIAAGCVLTMLWLAWRIASAPPLLFGNDLQAEQVVDRETRAIRTGKTCFLTLCAVTVFTSFVGLPFHFVVYGITYHGINVLAPALLVLCAALWMWKSFYVRHLTRTPLAA
jgi:hypothetical protein